MSATIEEFAHTVAAYEAAAINTGQWDGIDAPEFSADGANWAPVWLGDGTPAFARVTVYRKDVRVPYTAIIAWSESLPAVDEWRALWERKPMTLFGAAAKRDAIRHAFRDVIGDRRDEDERDPAAPAVGAQPPAPADRDWDAEIAAAETEDALTSLWGEMRGARARTGAREKAYHDRLAALAAAEPDAWAPATKPGRQPSDYRPAANRAERRTQARKKGRRK